MSTTVTAISAITATPAMSKHALSVFSKSVMLDSQCIRPGSQVTTPGTMNANPTMSTSATTNGAQPRNASHSEISLIIEVSRNTFRPSGGMISPSSMIIIITTPNQTGSNPRPTIIG